MTLHHGDCLDVMAAMEPESVDAIVTDPPYGLAFMGKAWDDAARLASRPPSADRMERDPYPRTGKGPTAVAFDGRAFQGWCEDWGRLAYRVAKPSAYLLAFGGTRTVHRMTVALEDAGWIIRDMLVWGYASGFPKSKASLKPAWEPIVMARKPGPLRMLAIDECRIPSGGELAGWHKATGSAPRFGGGVAYGGEPETFDDGPVEAHPAGRWPANIVLTDPIFDGGIEGVVGGGETNVAWTAPSRGIGQEHDRTHGKGFGEPVGASPNIYGDSGTYSRFFTIPGGMSCDWCGASLAAPSSPPSSDPGGSAPSHAAIEAFPDSTTTTDSPPTSGIETRSSPAAEPPTTRTRSSRGSRLVAPSLSSDPANNAALAETWSGTIPTTPSRPLCSSCAAVVMRSYMDEPEFAASRSYPWAFLIPKADRSDREPVLGGLPERFRQTLSGNRPPTTDQNGTAPRDGAVRQNVHPTVKPTDLMRHLVRLVTPAGGTVLDPFLGSGTTALAAEMEGFAWIGIEREAEYVAIAEARLNGTQRGLGLSTEPEVA